MVKIVGLLSQSFVRTTTAVASLSSMRRNRLVAATCCSNFSTTPSAPSSSSSSSSKNRLSLFYEVITPQEEEQIMAYLTPLLARRRYEGSHWDSVITRYKEIELHPPLDSNVLIKYEAIDKILDKVREHIRQICEEPDLKFLSTHCVDLASDGHIGKSLFLLNICVYLCVFFSLSLSLSLVCARARRFFPTVPGRCSACPSHPSKPPSE
jgi:hypothetical protein